MGRQVIVWLTLAFFLLLGESTFGNGRTQDAESGQDDEVVSPEVARLQQLLVDSNQSTTLSDSDKETIAKELGEAIEQLNKLNTFQSDAAKDDELAGSAANRLAETKIEFDATATEISPDLTRGLELPDVDLRLSEVKDKLKNANDEVTKQETEIDRRTTRRKEIATEIDTLNGNIAALEQTVSRTPSPDELPEVTTAKLENAKATLLAHQAERDRLNAELRMYDAEAELLPIKLDLARRKENLLEDQVEAFTSRQTYLRKTEAEQHAQQAEEFAIRFAQYENVRLVAELAADTSLKRIELGTKLTEINREVADGRDQLTRFQDEATRTRNRVETVGTTTSIGLLLRKQRTSLPNSTSIQISVRQRHKTIRETEFELYNAKDLRKKFSDPDRIAKTLADEYGLDADDIRPLLQLQREVAGDYQLELDEYFDRLVDANVNAQRLLDEIEDYASFIDQNILWVRSNVPVWELEPDNFREASATFLSTSEWSSFGEVLLKRVRGHLGLLSILSALWIALVWQQKRLRRIIEKQSELVAPVTSTKYRPTLIAVGLTLIIALVWPLLVWTIGWLLKGGDSTLFVAVGISLQKLAHTVVIFEFLRQFCRNDGLAIVHFKWPKRVAVHVRRTIRIALIVIVPVAFVHGVAEVLDDDAVQSTYQRFSFIALQGILLALSFLFFRPSNGLFEEHISRHPEGWISRTKYILLVLLLAIPAFQIVLALLGYLYTAEQLHACMSASISLVMILVLIASLLSRWVLVGRRRVRLSQFRERLTQHPTEMDTLATETTLDAFATETTNDVNLSNINAQSKRLIRSGLVIVGIFGLYLIWSGVLPALDELDRFQLWDVASSNGDNPIPITAKHLIILIPIIIGTWIAARNAPGLIEIAILQRLPLDSSVRYAITTLASYVIAMIGIVIAFRTLGFNWGSVQFIIAALGVGLGFGLQEIVANFISGIILLFERPIRIGDVVTIGEVTGVVSQIHIRATTITNWDRKDFVVPNKDLITGRLLNWTLSDMSSRIVINVGVAYDTDPDQPSQLLREIVTSHPKVLSDPGPGVTFEAFNDSSLLFVVRCYVGSVNDRLSTTHELHTEILKRFNVENIEIAFPQLDVNVRTQPLELTSEARENPVPAPGKPPGS